jgi:hypothetical protein
MMFEQSWLAGAQVKVLGWIKSAVEFIKTPIGPRTDPSQPDAPTESDSPAASQDAGPQSRDIQPETRTSVEPESAAEPAIQASPEVESRTIVEPEIGTSVEPESAQGEEEIDRRRGVVRAYFNDYWSSIDDKPASFAERLDGAEAYINERVASCGETWRLDPATRKQLGLPRSRKG